MNPRSHRFFACLVLGAALTTGGCTRWFLSGQPTIDRSRPVAIIETRGGREYGATTEEGILFLGRTATEGPCRVHYFLGDTPLIEDGEIRKLGGVYYLAEIDLKHQRVDVLPRDLRENEWLLAMQHTGSDVETVWVKVARDEGVEGDVLAWPGQQLRAGTALFADEDDGYEFVGLVTGSIEMQGAGGSHRYLTFAGADRLREALATPRVHPQATEVKHRPDDISVFKPKQQ